MSLCWMRSMVGLAMAITVIACYEGGVLDPLEKNQSDAMMSTPTPISIPLLPLTYLPQMSKSCTQGINGNGTLIYNSNSSSNDSCSFASDTSSPISIPGTGTRLRLRVGYKADFSLPTDTSTRLVTSTLKIGLNAIDQPTQSSATIVATENVKNATGFLFDLSNELIGKNVFVKIDLLYDGISRLSAMACGPVGSNRVTWTLSQLSLELDNAPTM